MSELEELTKLTNAVEKGDLKQVKSIIQSLSSKIQKEKIVNAINTENQTLLIIAVLKGHKKIVKYLLQSNANVSYKTKTGWNCLHFATLESNIQIFELLLPGNESLLEEKTKDTRETVKDIAIKKKNRKILAILEKYNSNNNNSNKIKIKNNDENDAESEGRLIKSSGNGSFKHLLSPSATMKRLSVSCENLKSLVKKDKKEPPDSLSATLDDGSDKRLSLSSETLQRVAKKADIKEKKYKKEDQMSLLLPEDSINPIVKRSSAKKKNKFDVMLSYQWASQKFVLELKDFLEEKGLRVWIDVQEMHGDIIQRMQEGINNSTIIILCMTKKYEQSQNCRLEFNYAFKQMKEIIPIKLEEFRPSNELDIITMNKLYYEFWGRMEIRETKKLELFNGIQRILIA